MAARTARLNTARGLLHELGIAIPIGATRVVPVARALCARGDASLPTLLRQVLRDVVAEIGELERRMRDVGRLTRDGAWA